MNKIFAAVFGLLFFLCSSCAAYSPQGYVFVTMLDVGQGDSFLIETPEKNILLDAGDVGSPLVDKLKAAGIERLERVILTHPHADHIGGVDFFYAQVARLTRRKVMSSLPCSTSGRAIRSSLRRPKKIFCSTPATSVHRSSTN